MSKIAYGYLIFDTEGRAQLHTFASNRAECWEAFTGFFDGDRGKQKQAIRKWKAQGFHCVPGYFKAIEVQK